ncbi:MAG: metallophosphoesterase [Ignavibacteria bacterium]
MIKCFFVSDLHGHEDRYISLFEEIKKEKPAIVFIGGDILLSGVAYSKSRYNSNKDFLNKFLYPSMEFVKYKMGEEYPEIYLIMGNDDPREEEESIIKAAQKNIFKYIHNRKIGFNDFTIYGYAYVPPTPFRLKDWEKYDVSRFTDPGCNAPIDGIHTVPVDEHQLMYSTIKDDLEKLTGNDNLEKSVFLFHSPPHNTKLDYANLDGKKIDGVELDVHVGSIAIRKFIEKRKPLITLHGHIHESVRITGSWKDKIGDTLCFSAAHDKKELALVEFDLEKPEEANRRLI